MDADAEGRVCCVVRVLLAVGLGSREACDWKELVREDDIVSCDLYELILNETHF